jgi:hypothetical protein
MTGKLNLKNYTTSVPAERSIGEIEGLLSMFGATAVMKEYGGDGQVSSLAFKYQDNIYKLPANKGGVYEVLFTTKSSSRRDEEANRDRRAYNVAWRLIKDWVYTQLSIIVAKQATPEQIMLPFLWDGKRTFFQAYTEGLIRLENKQK